MTALSWIQPKTAGEAVAQWQAGGGTFLAGGTEVVPWIKESLLSTPRLIDISRCGLDRLHGDDGALVIGATVTLAQLAAHSGLERDFPGLAQAVWQIGSPQIRNAGTVAGNLLQRSRCPYFRYGGPCEKRDAGSGCQARESGNRLSALVGHGARCVATHPSDLAVVLVGLEARVRVLGPAGGREIHLEALYPDRNDDPQLEHHLSPGEIITAIVVPSSALSRSGVFIKVRERAGFDFGLVTLAAHWTSSNGLVSAITLVAGGVAHRPWSCERAAAGLLGGPLNRDRLVTAIRAEFAEAPAPGAEFKRGLVERAALTALGLGVDG